MKVQVCEALAKMPEEIREYITTNCWFISSLADAWAFAFTGNDLANQHLIFLSDELLQQDVSQIRFTIAHEIGHIVLKHRNSVKLIQTQTEIKRQELEADQFAMQYI
jgi:Zn-dependent protease with chaperone function